MRLASPAADRNKAPILDVLKRVLPKSGFVLEIAAGLHLSIKTVGHHVSAILRKTGSESRRELRD